MVGEISRRRGLDRRIEPGGVVLLEPVVVSRGGVARGRVGRRGVLLLLLLAHQVPGVLLGEDGALFEGGALLATAEDEGEGDEG